MKRRGVLVTVGALVAAVLTAGVWFSPLPYIVRQPGPTVDVLGTTDGREVIAVTGADVSPSAGRLLLTTVEVVDGIGAADAARTWFGDRNASRRTKTAPYQSPHRCLSLLEACR
jgi:Lon-like protease